MNIEIKSQSANSYFPRITRQDASGFFFAFNHIIDFYKINIIQLTTRSITYYYKEVIKTLFYALFS
jgi:hypothetical protein